MVGEPVPNDPDIYVPGMELAQAYIALLTKAIAEIPLWQVCKAAKLIMGVREVGGTVWCLGNGGSQANAAHLSLHLQERGIRAVDMMAEAAVASALANDYTYEAAFAKRLRLLVRPGDALAVISGSGNSVNILTALAEARQQSIPTIGLFGFGGGMARGLVRVPITLNTGSYGQVEDTHSAVVHIISEMLGAASHGPALAR